MITVSDPFKLGPPGRQVPFGEIRVALHTGLLAIELTPALRSAILLAIISVLASVLFAAVVSTAILAPVERFISAQLDRISRGEFDQKPLERGDEFGQVSTKISQIGLQLRGVREIFSTLRENLDQILGGLGRRPAALHARWPRCDGEPRGRKLPGLARCSTAGPQSERNLSS